MSSKKFIAVGLIIILTITSCGKKSTPGPAPAKKATVVYITGIGKTANGLCVATYWKNGIRIALADSNGNNSSVATGIAISDTDVYISGAVNGFTTYWKNGKAVTIPQAILAYANAITVSGTDVYIAGEGDKGPTYLKNGVPVALDVGGGEGFADGITVVGNDVYVGGNYRDAGVEQVVYWKNGARTTVANSPSGYATLYSNIYLQGWVNIAVNGSNIYLTGATPGVLTATYWKNETAVNLLNNPTQQSFLNNIAISGTDVYVAGNYYTSAVYWKNGMINTLPGGTKSFAMATAIAIDGSDVYVTGSGGRNPSNSALYWKNGTLLALPGNAWTTTGIALMQR